MHLSINIGVAILSVAVCHYYIECRCATFNILTPKRLLKYDYLDYLKAAQVLPW
jgi:hypothetical protein